MNHKMIVALLLATSSANAQDVATGKRVFNKCAAGHAVGPNAANKIGPELNGLFGRAAGSVHGFSYSDANKKSGIT
jgi:cytochrome c